MSSHFQQYMETCKVKWHLYTIIYIVNFTLTKFVCRLVEGLWIEEKCQKWHSLYQELLTSDNISTESWTCKCFKLVKFMILSTHLVCYIWHTNSNSVWHTLYQK